MSCFDDQSLLQEVLGRISARHVDQFASLPTAHREQLEQEILALLHKELDRDESFSSMESDLLTNPDISSPSSNELRESAFQSLFAAGCKRLGDDGWKIEITSFRESAFGGLGCLGLVFGVVLWVSSNWQASLVVFFMGICSAVLRSNTDDYLILNTRAKSLLYYKKLFGMEKLEQLISFFEIHSVAVDSKFIQAKDGHHWKYNAIAISKSGKVVYLGDYEEDVFNKKAELAFAVSMLANVPLLPPEPEKKLIIQGPGSRIMATYDS